MGERIMNAVRNKNERKKNKTM